MDEQIRPDEWIGKEAAANGLRCSTKSIERYATQGRIQRRYVPVPGQRPTPLFYAPDVEKLREELYGIEAFEVTAESESVAAAIAPQPSALARRANQDATALLAAFAGITDRFGQHMSELATIQRGKSADHPTTWVSVASAAQASGLPAWYLRQAIRDGRLRAHDVSQPGAKHPRFRVRLADVEVLEPTRVCGVGGGFA